MTGPSVAQAGDDLVREAADDLERPAARRVEAVERVEDRGARATQEGLLLDEHDRGAGARRGDGGRRRPIPTPTTTTSALASNGGETVSVPRPDGADWTLAAPADAAA